MHLYSLWILTIYTCNVNALVHKISNQATIFTYFLYIYSHYNFTSCIPLSDRSNEKKGTFESNLFHFKPNEKRKKNYTDRRWNVYNAWNWIACSLKIHWMEQRTALLEREFESARANTTEKRNTNWSNWYHKIASSQKKIKRYTHFANCKRWWTCFFSSSESFRFSTEIDRECLLFIFW